MIDHAHQDYTPAASSVTVDVVSALRNHWLLLVVGVVIGSLLAGVYCLTTPSIYSSKAEILVLPKDAGLASHSSRGDDQLGLDSGLSDETLATHLQIIRSTKILGDAIDARQLLLLDSLRAEIPTDALADPELTQKAAIAYLSEHLTAERGGTGQAKNAQVIRLSFQHPAAADCATILDAILESYQEFVGETVHGVGEEASILIQQAGSELEQQIQKQDEQYAEFLRQSRLVVDGEKTVNPHQAKILEYELEISRLQVAIAETKSRLAIVEDQIEQGSAGVAALSSIDNDDVSRLALMLQVDETRLPSVAASREFSRVMDLTAESARQAVSLGPNHPQALEAQALIQQLKDTSHYGMPERIADVEEQIDADRLIATYAKLLQGDLVELERSRDRVLSLIESEQVAAKGLVDLELEQKRRSRELERAETLYDAVVDRLGEINLLRDYGGFANEVLVPVELGEVVWPQPKLLLAFGAFLGLFFGTAGAVAAELFDRSFRSPGQIEQALGCPILNHIPALRTKAAPSPDGVNSSIVVWHEPMSAEAEAFRGLRASVLFRTQGWQHPIIQVTSAREGDGATTVASNLAASLAQAGNRVLLVDCDLRKPDAENLFDAGHERTGFTEVLDGEELVEDAIVTTRVGNLSMLPRGGPKSNAAELLASPALRHTLDYAVSQFDYVILDSPPVLEVADAVAIAQHAHGVLLCLGLTNDARLATQRARDQLVDNGADILGLVVNNFGGFRWELGAEQSYRRDAAYSRPTRRTGKSLEFSSVATRERLKNGEN